MGMRVVAVIFVFFKLELGLFVNCRFRLGRLLVGWVAQFLLRLLLLLRECETVVRLVTANSWGLLLLLMLLLMLLVSILFIFLLVVVVMLVIIQTLSVLVSRETWLLPGRPASLRHLVRRSRLLLELPTDVTMLDQEVTLSSSVHFSSSQLMLLLHHQRVLNVAGVHISSFGVEPLELGVVLHLPVVGVRVLDHQVALCLLLLQSEVLNVASLLLEVHLPQMFMFLLLLFLFFFSKSLLLLLLSFLQRLLFEPGLQALSAGASSLLLRLLFLLFLDKENLLLFNVLNLLLKFLLLELSDRFLNALFLFDELILINCVMDIRYRSDVSSNVTDRGHVLLAVDEAIVFGADAHCCKVFPADWNHVSRYFPGTVCSHVVELLLAEGLSSCWVDHSLVVLCRTASSSHAFAEEV